MSHQRALIFISLPLERQANWQMALQLTMQLLIDTGGEREDVEVIDLRITEFSESG